MKKKIKLSIVIIGYNESKNIKRTMSAIEKLNFQNITTEIIYVDSNSDDDSIEVLKQYRKIKILKIKSNKYTASLARLVGSKAAKGEYILFLDADMEITENTDLKKCIELFEKDYIGIVSGKLPEIWYKNNKVMKKIKDRYDVKGKKEDLKSPGGYFIINKNTLEKCGNFNFELLCNEEAELFSRVKKEGYKLIRTVNLECIHHHYTNDFSKKPLNKFKNKFYASFWKAIVSSIKANSIKEYLSFGAQKRALRSITMTLIMIILFFISLWNISFILIPIVYYTLIYIKNKGDITNIIFNQISNLCILISFIFFIDNERVIYDVIEVQ